MSSSTTTEGIALGESSSIKDSDPKIIVVAVDESRGSEIAFKEALRILGARKCTAVFHVVHVRPVQDEYQVNALYSFKGHGDKLEKTRMEIAKNLLQRFKAIAEAAHVAFVEVLLQGDARAEICKYSQKVHAELLVVGQRGAGLLTRMFIGSVSLYCLHHADVPVLVVKTPPTALAGAAHSKVSNAVATDAIPEATSKVMSEDAPQD